MKLYTPLKLNHARSIITLVNKIISIYKISKITSISKGKIKICLEGCKKESKKFNIKQYWKDKIVSISYSWKNYKEYRNQTKLNYYTYRKRPKKKLLRSVPKSLRIKILKLEKFLIIPKLLNYLKIWNVLIIH